MLDTLTVAQIAGIVNIGAGVLLMVALLLFFGGLGTWAVHLGLPHRDEGIILMEHGVVLLFTLVCILGIARLVQFHTQAVLQILAIALILFGGYIVIIVARSGGEEEKKR